MTALSSARNSTNMDLYLESQLTTTENIIFSENVSGSNADQSYIDSLNNASAYLWIIFSPIFLFVGVFGNILNLFVLRKMHFEKNPTLILLFLLSFTDIAVLLVGLPRYWARDALQFDLRTVSQFSCKVSLFLIYISMQLSSWILVMVSVIRMIKTVLPLRFPKKKIRVTRKNTLTVFCIVVIVLCIINVHFFITNGVITEKGEAYCTSLTPDFSNFDEYVFVYIDFLILSVFPAIIIIVCNIFIYHVLKNMKRRRASTSSTDKVTSVSVSRVTRMLFVTSSYFVISTAPISLHFIADSYVRPGSDDLTQAKLDMSFTVLYLFQFSHFVINFYCYTFTNKRFRRSVKKLKDEVKNRCVLSLFFILSFFNNYFVINFYCYTVTNKRYRRSVIKLKDKVKKQVCFKGFFVVF